MNTFIDNYKLYSGGNEASPIYHKWSAISVLSSAVSRRVWFDFGTFTHYPNLYIILVGGPGNGKSTAMSIGRKIVRDVQDIPVAPPAITKEAITQLMGDKKGGCVKTFEFDDEPIEYSHLSMYANEIATTLNTGGNAQGMVEFFTDVWDQPVFEYKTKGSGTDKIVGPFITLLGCMTPEQTGQMLKENIISGGFSRRCLFVYTHDRGAPIPRPIITPEQAQAKRECVQWCTMLGNVKGSFTMDDDAIEFYDDWYIKNHKLCYQETSPVMQSYRRTKDCLLVKTAMLYALGTDYEMANGKAPKVLKRHHFEYMLAMFNEVEPNIPKVFEGFGRNVLADVSAKILTTLQAAPNQSMHSKKLQAAMWEHASTEEFQQAITHMSTTDVVSRVPYTVGGVTRGEIYKVNK